MVVAVAAQVWPLLAFVGVVQAAALIWYAHSGDGVPAAMTWEFVKTATFGLAGAFALHELAHVAVLRRIGTVTGVAVARNRWRVSVTPAGTMTARQVVAVAVAGPLACVLVGAVLWLSGLDRDLAWWFLAHVLFLLPLFGDGRSLLAGLLGHGAENLSTPAEQHA